MLVPKGFLLQPVNGEGAGRCLAEPVFFGTVGRVLDVRGPKVRTMAELTDVYLKIAGRQRNL
jgi:uncharacterized protein YbjT (DUF2867 family)